MMKMRLHQWSEEDCVLTKVKDLLNNQDESIDEYMKFGMKRNVVDDESSLYNDVTDLEGYFLKYNMKLIILES